MQFENARTNGRWCHAVITDARRAQKFVSGISKSAIRAVAFVHTSVRESEPPQCRHTAGNEVTALPVWIAAALGWSRLIPFWFGLLQPAAVLLKDWSQAKPWAGKKGP